MGETDEPASARYVLLEPAAARLPLWRWITGLFEALTPPGGATTWEQQYLHQVADRSNGSIVYKVTTGPGPDFRAARESISRDLNALSADQFADEYGIRAGDGR